MYKPFQTVTQPFRRKDGTLAISDQDKAAAYGEHYVDTTKLEREKAIVDWG